MLGHDIYFKIESSQKTGSFKVRGALHHLLSLKSEGKLPSCVVSYSTGNHALGLSFAAKTMGVKARIYLPQTVSQIKKKAAMQYGAEVIYTKTRGEAEELTYRDHDSGQMYHISPSNSWRTVAGSSTLCYEALGQMQDSPDAIFASCGAGGLLTGSYIAKSIFSSRSKIIGAEPAIADDAYRTFKDGKLHTFKDEPKTIADGLRSLRVAEFCMPYIQKLDDFLLASEDEILYWTAWLNSTLDAPCEPSCAVAMVAAQKWLAMQKTKQKILVLISGGNIDCQVAKAVSIDKYLKQKPEPAGAEQLA